MQTMRDFLSPQAGQKRRAWLEDTLNEGMRYYLGPTGIPDRLAALGILNPINDMEQASQNAQRVYRGETDAIVPMITDMATVLAPVAGARVAGGDATAAVVGSLLGMGGPTRQGAQDWAGNFARMEDGMFLGPSALTADQDALRLARKMADEGADRTAIWNETGWFQGVDGKWRFEIDDSAFGLRDRATRPVEKYTLFGRADQTINHPELSQAYDLPFEYDLGVGNALRGGSMRAPTRWRTDIPDRGISAGDIQEMGRIRARGVDRPELERTTLHEIQHAIQDVEDFSRGSNVSDEAAQIAASRDRELMQQVERALTPQETADLARYRELSAQYKNAGTVPGDVVIEVNDLRKRLRRVDGLMDEVRALRTQGQGGALEGGVISREAAYDQYRRVAGEVEARNVETRRDFTLDQRRATPPWETMDVPEADQIVRFGSGNALRAYLGL